MFQNETQLAG